MGDGDGDGTLVGDRVRETIPRRQQERAVHVGGQRTAGERVGVVTSTGDHDRLRAVREHRAGQLHGSAHAIGACDADHRVGCWAAATAEPANAVATSAVTAAPMSLPRIPHLQLATDASRYARQRRSSLASRARAARAHRCVIGRSRRRPRALAPQVGVVPESQQIGGD